MSTKRTRRKNWSCQMDQKVTMMKWKSYLSAKMHTYTLPIETQKLPILRPCHVLTNLMSFRLLCPILRTTNYLSPPPPMYRAIYDQSVLLLADAGTKPMTIALAQTVELTFQRLTCYAVTDLHAQKRCVFPSAFTCEVLLMFLLFQFHLSCQGLLEKPSGGWFCDSDCRENAGFRVGKQSKKRRTG
jgi:hypothetical protein